MADFSRDLAEHLHRAVAYFVSQPGYQAKQECSKFPSFLGPSALRRFYRVRLKLLAFEEALTSSRAPPAPRANVYAATPSTGGFMAPLAS